MFVCRVRSCVQVEVVFKGFHESIDSFGAFAYPDAAPSFDRLPVHQSVADGGPAHPKVHGCSLATWTGACVLQRSNEDEDVNAPPDVLAAHRRETLAQWFRRQGVRRVFACGLVTDFCVMDTALNALAEGFEGSYLILDAARAAHLPGMGLFGSGFLSDPATMRDKMATSGVRVIPSAALLPASSPLYSDLIISSFEQSKSFPEQLGPFALVTAEKLRLTLDEAALQWTGEAVAAPEIPPGLALSGHIAPPFALTFGPDARARAGIAPAARYCAVASPAATADDLSYKAQAYLTTMSSTAAFLVNGGFVYLDEDRAVCDVRVLAMGQGLEFKPPRPWDPSFSPALRGRWRPVAAAALRRRGAQLVAWINPGETLTAMDGATLKLRQGAFVYLFHEDIAARDPRDIYFVIKQYRARDAYADNIGRISREIAQET